MRSRLRFATGLLVMMIGVQLCSLVQAAQPNLAWREHEGWERLPNSLCFSAPIDPLMSDALTLGTHTRACENLCRTKSLVSSCLHGQTCCCFDRPMPCPGLAATLERPPRMAVAAHPLFPTQPPHFEIPRVPFILK